MQIGQTDIVDIVIDVTSRDDTPMILLGLQHTYTSEPLKKAVFKIPEDIIPFKQTDDTADLANQHMARIDVEVIRAGYQLLDIDIHQLIRGRCDSFVLKTNVHFPTDINLRPPDLAEITLTRV